MDLIFRIDRRSAADVEAVIRFAQADPFWQSNILSVGKLRDKYDTLNAKRKGRFAQIDNRPSLTCTKRIQPAGARFMRDCGKPASLQSRPSEPRCADHLVHAALQGAASC